MNVPQERKVVGRVRNWEEANRIGKEFHSLHWEKATMGKLITRLNNGVGFEGTRRGSIRWVILVGISIDPAELTEGHRSQHPGVFNKTFRRVPIRIAQTNAGVGLV